MVVFHCTFNGCSYFSKTRDGLRTNVSKKQKNGQKHDFSKLLSSKRPFDSRRVGWKCELTSSESDYYLFTWSIIATRFYISKLQIYLVLYRSFHYWANISRSCGKLLWLTIRMCARPFKENIHIFLQWAFEVSIWQSRRATVISHEDGISPIK